MNNNPIKVMHIIHGLTMGGAETLVKEYCLGLKQRGVNVICLSLDYCDSSYERILNEAGIKIIYVNKKINSNLPSVIKKIVREIKRYIGIRYYIRVEAPDIIHTHLKENAYIRFARPKKSIKIFHTVHSEPKAIWSKGIVGKLDFKSAKWLAKKYKMRFIVLHEKMRKEVNGMFNVNDSVVLNNGIDFNRFNKLCIDEQDKLKEKLKIPKESFVVGHVGRFAQVKNHKFIVEIFHEIYIKRKDAFLILIGDGPLEKEIVELLIKYDLQNCSLILNDRTDIPELMSIMNLFLMPSLYEGLPVVLVEAQKIGLPCLISENIEKSVDISNLIKRKSLKDSAQEWAEQALDWNIENIIYENLEDWNMETVVDKLIQLYIEEIESRI